MGVKIEPLFCIFRRYLKYLTLKQFAYRLAIILLASSCNRNDRAIVSATYFDSLISHYTEPSAVKQYEEDLVFWQNRIDPKNPGMVNESRYASALVRRFHHSGDINDLHSSDSVLRIVDSVFGHKEASPNLGMAVHCMLEHRFADADKYFAIAKNIGLKNYETFSIGFDIDFELGRYVLAEKDLEHINKPGDYGYSFRLAKLEHYKGDLKASISAMQDAIKNSGSDLSLQSAATSNLADLYLHDGNTSKAYENYLDAIKLNTSDLHSIMGAGWIALMHDKNDSLAEKIFHFVASKTNAPDAILKLALVAEYRKDSLAQKKYAQQFEQIVTAPQYGGMYNKYMIDLYTGILNDPGKAEAIAMRELTNRNTPQTQAWYVWSLYCNGKKDMAYKIYEEKVSGKPLEGPELYHMGMMMQGLGKNYNAKEFFKAAIKNKYDLSPAKIEYLQKELQ
jgi:hypothetical protein